MDLRKGRMGIEVWRMSLCGVLVAGVSGSIKGLLAQCRNRFVAIQLAKGTDASGVPGSPWRRVPR